MDSEEILTSFRQEWQRELENVSSQRENCPPNYSPANSSSFSETFRNGIQSDIEIKAAELFNKGVQLEQNGQLYESITFYKRAISLVPDIEFRVHHRYMQEKEEVQLSSSSDEEDSVSEELFKNGFKDLISKFEALFGCNQPLCQPNFSQESSHLSCLPAEMVEKILAWVVGREHDFYSLECIACVCRGFYLLCNKSDIWKKACLCVWGINTGELINYGSWREMYIWRPHPRFNGCYISRTTYFRSGENSFQDLTYQPWHIVSYYRYMRFFPGGQVLMLTTSEEPQTMVGHLRKMDTKYPQVLHGYYRIHGNSLMILFRRTSGKTNNKVRGRKRGQGTTDVADTTLQMELELKSVRERPNWQLIWQCYSVVSTYYNGSHATSVVDVSDTNSFPQLSFSRVKSYSAESEQPLT